MQKMQESIPDESVTFSNIQLRASVISSKKTFLLE